MMDTKQDICKANTIWVILMSDLISRSAAIDTLKMDISIIPFAKAREYVRAAIETIYNRLEELPPAEPEATERIYKRGYADGYHKAEKDYFKRNEKDRDDVFKAGVEIGRAKRKRGRWIDGSIPTYAVCSECGYQERYAYENNYCHNCGADMRGEQDDQ